MNNNEKINDAIRKGRGKTIEAATDPKNKKMNDWLRSEAGRGVIVVPVDEKEEE